jgi:heparin binding hemagglutinin HbhA
VSTTQEKKRNSAVYAAAGIGDLAYEQLKKIPALAEELRTKAGTLREQGPSWRAQATDKAAELAGKVDVDKIRTVLVTNAQKAAEKAASLYDDLVARGEKVVESDAPATVSKAADTVADGAARVFDEAVKVSEQTAKASQAPAKAADTVADGAARVFDEAVKVSERTAKASQAPAKPAAPRKPKATPGTTK